MAFHDIEREWRTDGGLRMRVSNCAPHGSTPPHAHERPVVCLILGGTSVQRAGARELTRDRGRAYFYPANELQSERFGTAGGRIFTLELDGVDRLPDASSELTGSAALFMRRCWTGIDDLDRDEAVASLTALLTASSREREDVLRWMHVARDYLRALRVDDAARRLAASEQSIAAIAIEADFDSQSHSRVTSARASASRLPCIER